jgi:hypothetical protein
MDSFLPLTKGSAYDPGIILRTYFAAHVQRSVSIRSKGSRWTHDGIASEFLV